MKMETTTSTSGEGRGAEIVFFDMETTVPNRAGERFWVLEFGAIVVCPRKLVELESYCTLIRPRDLTVVAVKSGRSDGITRRMVATAPMFEDVADRIFGILDGRVWAGHNIQRFDCARIKEAFADIGRPAPVPIGMIDSLGVLKQKFGKRAGNMKMATLAAYFGLGQQKHRSLEDVRMNLEVLKHCATVLFLESNLPAVLANNSQGSSTVVTRSRSKKGIPNAQASLDCGVWRGTDVFGFNPASQRRCFSIRTHDHQVVMKQPYLVITRSRSNGQLLYGEETRRKSPHTPLEYQRTVPYPRGKFGKMTERVKDLLCKAQNKPPLTSFLKHSHLLLRR